MNGHSRVGTLNISGAYGQVCANFPETSKGLHARTREKLEKLLGQRLDRMRFESKDARINAQRWLTQKATLILKDWGSEAEVGQKTINVWLSHLIKKFRRDQRKELTIINRQINYQDKNADKILEVTCPEELIKELLAEEVEDFSPEGRQVIEGRALTKLKKLRQSKETITKNRLKAVVRFAIEGTLNVILSTNFSENFFKRTLAKAVRGFHKRKGKVSIKKEAWQKFKILQPQEKTIEKIQTIIADAVSHRRKYNEDRGREIVARRHLEKAAREAVEKVIDGSNLSLLIRPFQHEGRGGETHY